MERIQLYSSWSKRTGGDRLPETLYTATENQTIRTVLTEFFPDTNKGVTPFVYLLLDFSLPVDEDLSSTNQEDFSFSNLLDTDGIYTTPVGSHIEQSTEPELETEPASSPLRLLSPVPVGCSLNKVNNFRHPFQLNQLIILSSGVLKKRNL